MKEQIIEKKTYEGLFAKSIPVILVLLLLFLLQWMIHLNFIRWDAWINAWGKTVKSSEVHELGPDRWFFQNDKEPFSGIAEGMMIGNKEKIRSFFRDGMLHHREIIDHASDQDLAHVFYLGGKVQRMQIWTRDGQYLGEYKEQSKWLDALRNNNYLKFLD